MAEQRRRFWGGWRLKEKLHQRSQIWLKKRLPRARTTTLDQRRIFILPSRNGLYYLLMTAVLFLGGINYGNSLILLIALLLASLFLVSILHTFANLSGLTLEAGRTQPAFAGQQVAFAILLRSGGREHEAVQLSWPDLPPQQHDLVERASAEITMLFPVSRRGWWRPPRLRVESIYPLGLLRAWSWVTLESECLVYPKPVADTYPQRETQAGARGERLAQEGSDDFEGLRRYQPGDSPRRIAWKSYAREGRLYSKSFASYKSEVRWLEWEAYSGLSQEARLSRLCYWVLQLDKQQQRFGLQIPGVAIEPDSGDRHRQRCLKALALYGLDKQPPVDVNDAVTAPASVSRVAAP